MPPRPDARPRNPETPEIGRVLASQPPAPRHVLRWVYAWRVILSVGLLALTPWASLPVWQARAVPVAVAAALLLTGLSFRFTHRRTVQLPAAFAWLQLVLDALLLTLAVLLTGGQQSVFVSFYILIFSAAALLLPLVECLLIGIFAVVLYAASIGWLAGGLDGAVIFQIALFGVVILATSYLGERLRIAGAALGEVQTELRQLRMDTGDILNTVNSGVITVDAEGRLAFLNPAAEELLSLSAGAWEGRPVLEKLDAIAPGLGEVIARSTRARIAVRRFETEPVGDAPFVLGVSTTLVDRGGELSGVTAIFQDITEKMRVEALRRRAERLEAVAELSASLAHEIKNPLASIRSAVEQMAGGEVDGDDAATLRTLVVRESDRLSRLLGEFIDFARVKLTAPQPVELTALVQEVTRLVRAHPDAANRTLSLALPDTPDPLWIRGAEDLLHRAVFNLVLNAVQWAGEDGRVELTLDEVRSDLLSPAVGALGLVRLTVADSGPGVSPSILESIFDPFFTRRPGGTGLGLALVQRAVEAHGGAVFVDNAPASSGMGATFTLYLPGLSPELAAGILTESQEPNPL